MIVLAWMTVGILWMLAAAFAVSDVLCILAAVFHFRKEPELAAIYVMVVLVFTIFSAGAAYAALAVGRCL